MQSILFAFIAYVGWGAGGIFEATVARRMSASATLFWLLCGSLILSSLYIPFVTPTIFEIPVWIFLFTLILSIITVYGGTIFYYEAFRTQNPALVQTIAGSFPMVSTVLSLLFLGEKLSSSQVVAILIIFTGLILVLFEGFRLKSGNFRISRGLLFALLPMIFWGIYWAFIKIPVKEIGWFWPEYISFSVFLFVPLLVKIRGQKIDNPIKNRIFWPLLAAIILVRLAEFGYNFAIGQGLVAVVAPIAGSNPTLFVLLSFFIFKEPISKQQLAGVLVTLMGIVLLSIFSV